MRPPTAAALLALTVTLALTACGGGGGGSGDNEADDNGGAPSNPPGQSGPAAFTQQASWTFTLPPAGSSLCYDFNTKTDVADCSGKAWDLKVTSSGRGATLWTNSGSSGNGAGGAFGGPFDHSWSALQAWQNATTDPVNGAMPDSVYAADAAHSVFTGSNGIQSAAFEYGVGGSTDHRLYPNFRVFLLTTDSRSPDTTGTEAHPVFALQLIGYYGGSGGTTSGYPSFRWVDRRAPGTVRAATVDARSGWVYFDLGSGTVSSETGTWHIAFNRYNVKLNGGSSGPGQVGGFLAQTPAGFYDSQGAPVAAKFRSAGNVEATLADLTTADLAAQPASASAWVRDTLASRLNQPYRGRYPEALDYGWWTYYPTTAAAAAAGLPPVAHLVKATPERGALVRGGEGDTYARLQLQEIRYADPADAASAQTWTVHFDVQPAP
ncbi:HmuY family protein [Caldimonas brevitalea]|uniref:Uncharacterized protein n=1 Tax=Caldimonas brevitalea TaxID=413882 RepID=A0A0G3BGT2_9BURK|nr:HmuY family protein [Caldimonas brevitalea]AKJ27198.1 hypothetical protein AAW51_0507 [Caldimonas brevitalea]